MKKSQELSRKTWKMIAKNLIVLAVLIVVAFVGSFSWFTNSTSATADGISVKTEVSDGLEYYIVAPSDSDQYDNINQKLKDNADYNAKNPNAAPKNTKWHDGSITFDFTDPEFKFMEDIFLCEVTGDGKTFNIPKLVQYGEIAYVDKESKFDEAVLNEDYMSFDIYFRTNNKQTVTLKSGSSIAPTDKNIDATTEDGMKNAAIGAVRLSVLDSSTRKLLWIPGPNVWYDGKIDGSKGVLNIQTGAGFGKGSITYNNSTEQLEYTNELTSDHAYFDSSKIRQKVSSNGTNVIASTKGDYMLGNEVSLVKLESKDEANGYYYGHARINLWIEGEDAEARLKFVGGKFNMALKFGVAS